MKKFLKGFLKVLTLIEVHLFMGILYFIFFPVFKIFYLLFSLLKAPLENTRFRNVRPRKRKETLDDLKRGY